MTTTPIAAGPNDVTVRALFEQWYLRVVKGHPNNLMRDESGGYKFLATLFLAFAAGMVVEREACAMVCESRRDDTTDVRRQGEAWMAHELAMDIRKRSN